MADNSKIEWCDASWNPIKAKVRYGAADIARIKGYTSLVKIAEKNEGKVGWHCEHASTGCGDASGGGCYAEGINHRCLPAAGTGLPYDRRSRDLLEIFLDEKELLKPLKWKKPRRIFVESMSDWCATFVTDVMRDRILAVAALCPQHTFLFLTKRAKEGAEYFATIPMGDHDGASDSRLHRVACVIADVGTSKPNWNGTPTVTLEAMLRWPLPNVHLGFSAENQECFDERWSHMHQLAAAGWRVWCSAEPLLGPIDVGLAVPKMTMQGCTQCGFLDSQIRHYLHCEEPRLHQVVVGGESGPGARPMHPDWVRSLRDQCISAGVPFFFKQWGGVRKKTTGRILDGREWSEVPHGKAR